MSEDLDSLAFIGDGEEHQLARKCMLYCQKLVKKYFFKEFTWHQTRPVFPSERYENLSVEYNSYEKQIGLMSGSDESAARFERKMKRCVARIDKLSQRIKGTEGKEKELAMMMDVDLWETERLEMVEKMTDLQEKLRYLNM
jgi:hypothetical protein